MPADPARDEQWSEEERAVREAALDKTIADTFPASDPLSTNPNPCDYSLIDRTDDESERRER
jgi:hypothetical protein